jgi:hypothetical protein
MLMKILFMGAIITALQSCASQKEGRLDNVETTSPPSLKVTCDDVLIRIDGPKMWTLSRIEYKGTLLGIEDILLKIYFHRILFL